MKMAFLIFGTPTCYNGSERVLAVVEQFENVKPLIEEFEEMGYMKNIRWECFPMR